MSIREREVRSLVWRLGELVVWGFVVILDNYGGFSVIGFSGIVVGIFVGSLGFRVSELGAV